MYARIGDVVAVPAIGKAVVIAPEDDTDSYLVYVVGTGQYLRVRSVFVWVNYRVIREYTEVILDDD